MWHQLNYAYPLKITFKVINIFFSTDHEMLVPCGYVIIVQIPNQCSHIFLWCIFIILYVGSVLSLIQSKPKWQHLLQISRYLKTFISSKW